MASFCCLGSIKCAGAVGSGQAAAMHDLGLVYEKGWGGAQDYVKASECYQKGADAGDTSAKQASVGEGWRYSCPHKTTAPAAFFSRWDFPAPAIPETSIPYSGTAFREGPNDRD